MSDASTLIPRAAPAGKSARAGHSPPPVLISLPCGLDLGGVTTWAVNLANGLAARGGRVVLLAHPREEGAGRPEADVALALPAAAQMGGGSALRLDLTGVPLLKDAGGDLSPYLPAYRDILRSLADETGRPVVYLPNQLPGSFAIAAALCVAEPELIRVVAWQHADTPYDAMLLDRYAPVIHRFIAIDEAHAAGLRERLPRRAGEITSVPHGVDVPAEPPAERDPLTGTGGRRPVRLIYTGRLEHPQKRIGAYPLLADELTRRGVPHEIVLLGDGPAAAEMDAAAAARPSLRRVAACGAEEVSRWLEWADCFVLASRYEGLCLSRIEAMARGCVPIVTHASSGAGTGIRDGVSGMLVGTRPEDSPEAAARDLAEAVERFCEMASAGRSEGGARDMSVAAWADAGAAFSMESHVDGVLRVLAEAEEDAARFWPASRAPACCGSGAAEGEGSGSVPSGAAAKLRAKLDELRGRRILLHGCGRHTIELAGVLAECGGDIVAATDDDPAWWETREGQPRRFLGWPVVAPARAAEIGATDVLISSWLHQEGIWSRRAVYERQGLRMHRIYL
jgi:glycosyltransferase involved in cell wall biosynthesis